MKSLRAPELALEGVRILKRVYFDADTTEEFLSTMIIADLSRHYCEVDDSILQNLARVDETHNRLLLGPMACQGFDMFAWCLMATEVSRRDGMTLQKTLVNEMQLNPPNRCEIKVYHPKHAGTRHITFEDRSTGFVPSDVNGIPRPSTTPQPFQLTQNLPESSLPIPGCYDFTLRSPVSSA